MFGLDVVENSVYFHPELTPTSEEQTQDGSAQSGTEKKLSRLPEISAGYQTKGNQPFVMASKSLVSNLLLYLSLTKAEKLLNLVGVFKLNYNL